MRKSFVSKVLSVLLVLVVLFSASACNARGIPAFQEEISAQEMVRLIVSAINDKKNIADSFSSIPDSQKQNVTYSYFSEYISIIKEISSTRGNISSFRMLTPEEIDLYTGDYSNKAGYENLVAAEFLYEQDFDTPVYFFLSQNSQGKAFLSIDWIKDYISIYSYSQYYFSMLDDSNFDGLFSLLRPGLVGEEYTDATVYSRVNALIDYYQIKVRSLRSEFNIVKLLPDQMKVVIPEVLSEDNNTLTEHEVDITLSDNDSYVIVDEIPFYPDESLLSVYKSLDEVIRCGNHYSSEELYSLFGTPINLSVYSLDEDEISTETTAYEQKLIVNYRGMLLLFKVNFTSNDEWEGQLEKIRINRDCEFSIGSSGLCYGMTLSELLELYPYIEKTNYELNYEMYGVTYTVVLIFEENVLTDIRVTRV